VILGAILSRRRNLLIAGVFLLAGLATVSALMMPAGNQKASAQVNGCDPDIFGLLCLRKDAPSRIPFTFDLQRDGLRTVVEEIPCLGPSVQDEEFTEVLRGGEEIAIGFDCGIRVRERQEPGWDLVDIVCDYEDDYYDVLREGDGILILRDRLSEDTVEQQLVLRRDIECTFINREKRPNLGAGLGGLFAGQPTPLPTARPAAVAPAATAPSISPPRTGDAGLK
jgi:hypothetical protein